MKAKYPELPLTGEFIVRLIVQLLHLAYRGQLGETDALLYEAEQRFVRELYEEEQRCAD